MKAYLSEIFSSIQGEGPYVGERHLFVRFCGCHRACLYCDTVVEQTDAVQVEKVPGSRNFESIPNPISVDQLMELIQTLDSENENRRVSITGGEPLLQANFLEQLFPRLLESGRSIYLETSGDLPRKLEQVIEWIDVVAMDIKLSSVTNEASAFSSHWKFLEICRDAGVEVFAKLVLSAETDEGELMQAVKGIPNAGGAETLVVIQPMTRSKKTDAVPTGVQLLRWQEIMAKALPNVRVIPQTHLMMEML